MRCCCHSLLLYGKAIVFTCSKPIDASDWFNTQASSSGSTMFAFAGDFTVCSLVSYSLGFSGFSHSLHIPCTLPRLLCLQNNDLICPGKSIQSLKSSNWATKQTPRSASNGYSNFPQYLFLFSLHRQKWKPTDASDWFTTLAWFWWMQPILLCLLFLMSCAKSLFAFLQGLLHCFHAFCCHFAFVDSDCASSNDSL